MLNRSKTSLLLVTVVTLGGCTLMEPAADDPVLVKLDELDRRLQAIERVVQNQSLVNLTQQVSTIERRND